MAHMNDEMSAAEFDARMDAGQPVELLTNLRQPRKLHFAVQYSTTPGVSATASHRTISHGVSAFPAHA